MSGCDTGRSDPALGEGGMHLASAFLLGGASLVVAASDEVADTTAASFAAGLYASVDAAPTVEDIRQAQLALRSEDPDGWMRFRVWVP